MTLLGSALAALALASLILAVRPMSAVGRRLDMVAPLARRGDARWSGATNADLQHAGVGIDADRFLALRIGSALGGGLAAGLLSLVLPLGPAVVPAGIYAGAVLPALAVEARAREERRRAERATAVLVERLEALVAAGRPPETALALLMARPTGSRLLDLVLRRAADAHTLGAPVFRTLAAHAREDGLLTCALVAEELERARDLGSASLGAIRERRTALRAAERARSVEAAAQVEGKLMLILVLCHLPALIVLVVIPLFIGLLEGLFA